MELEFGRSGTVLIAILNCAGEPHVLKGGSEGWYEVTEIDWRLGWHLRVQVSITGTKEGYDDAWNGHLILPVVADDTVHLTFSIPDFIRPFKKSGWAALMAGQS